MPKVGEVKTANEVNHQGNTYYIWRICPACKTGSWVSLSNTKKQNYTGFCQHCYRRLCRAENHWNWKGGRYQDAKGYSHIYAPGHPYADKNGYIYEHRLLLEEKLGRYLLPSEVSHHRDEIKDRNEATNLDIFTSQSEHAKYHALTNHFWERRGNLRKEIA